MRPNAVTRSWLGIVLILVGVLLGLLLSASITWGESEAGLYTFYNGDRSLNIRCPLFLAQQETGTVTAQITNLINEDITPTVSAQISHAGRPRKMDRVVSLGPHSSTRLEWSVESSDVVFKYLVLVTILQLRYRDNPSMIGSCGILVFSLFGLSGNATFGIITAVSLIAMFLGAILWARAHPIASTFSLNLSRAGIVIIAITILALVSTILRWWWLTLVLDAGIVLMIGVIFSEFVLFPGKYKG